MKGETRHSEKRTIDEGEGHNSRKDTIRIRKLKAEMQSGQKSEKKIQLTTLKIRGKTKSRRDS